LRAQSLSSQFHEEIVLFRTIRHYSYFGMAVIVAVELKLQCSLCATVRGRNPP
jgi:hypothetical protein